MSVEASLVPSRSVGLVLLSPILKSLPLNVTYFGLLIPWRFPYREVPSASAILALQTI
ncbi:hypothetical protein [Hyphomicrobium sp.]|uniref:hypothetical protein n=1 Tax=Hyphomicrobium sp. TaxID=82 RepID=UPI002FDD268A